MITTGCNIEDRDRTSEPRRYLGDTHGGDGANRRTEGCGLFTGRSAQHPPQAAWLAADVRLAMATSPVGGPTLGPFARRSDALAQETAWLEAHWLVHPLAGPSAGPSAGHQGAEELKRAAVHPWATVWGGSTTVAIVVPAAVSSRESTLMISEDVPPISSKLKTRPALVILEGVRQSVAEVAQTSGADRRENARPRRARLPNSGRIGNYR